MPPPRRVPWLVVVAMASGVLVATGFPEAKADETVADGGDRGGAPGSAGRVGGGDGAGAKGSGGAGGRGQMGHEDGVPPGAAGGAPADLAMGPAGPAVHAPVPLAPIQPAYPEAAAAAGIEGDVALVLTIDVTGTVTDVAVEAGLEGGLTEAAVTAARAAHFRPASDAEGRPAPIRVRWLVHFALPDRHGAEPPREPGPVAAAPNGAAGASGGRGGAPGAGLIETFAVGEDATLSVRVRERGTGKDLPSATVFLEDFGELLHLDASARAEHRVPAGAVVVVVRAPGHHQHELIERVRPGQRLERTYYIEKERLNEYETVVHARPPRAEVGVITLEAEEIHNIPGTFGDPFRTTMLLPGVGSVISGVGYPVIRGESPGQTGTFIDDVRVPLLYHLGFGPAVVHPLFLESLDFHPGNFPAEFGRFSGALIHAHTTPAAEEPQTMLSVDLFKLSAYHARPFTLGGREGAVAVAARYGTFAFLARAIDPRAVLEYWDYQLRGDLKVAGGELRVLLFGASDTTGQRAATNDAGQPLPENLLRVGFHRLAVRYHAASGGTEISAGVELGPDSTTSSGDATVQPPDPPLTLQELVARPHLTVDRAIGPRVKLRMGADLLVQKWKVQVFDTELGSIFGTSAFPKLGLSPGAFVQADLRLGDRWLVTPGVRADYYDYFLDDSSGRSSVQQTSVDPRIAARFKVRPGLFLKGGFGRYSSPPRFLLPWPGLSGFGLDRGLNRSYQSSLGAELTLPWDATVDGVLYYNWIPQVTEFSFLRYMNPSSSFQRTFEATHPGRAYGIELIARRRLGHRLFGWVTYTYARAERDLPNQGWQPADFDEPHLANAVASYALGRSWTVSGVFHYNSGRPYTIAETADQVSGGGASSGGGGSVAPSDGGGSTTRSPDPPVTGRFPGFWRFDLRIEKREAFDTWYLDFYVDWLNISLQREAVSWDSARNRPNTVLLTIPTIGLQAVF